MSFRTGKLPKPRDKRAPLWPESLRAHAKGATINAVTGMQVFVLFDTMGETKILGVFQREAEAKAHALKDPAYLRVVPCQLDALNEDALYGRVDRSVRGRLPLVKAPMPPAPDPFEDGDHDELTADTYVGPV